MGTYDRSDPLRSQNQQREERGGSDFLIIIFSYNAGYAKHGGAKKPSFPDFGSFGVPPVLRLAKSRFSGLAAIYLFFMILYFVFIII